MNRLRVMHVTGGLMLGGLERYAVTLANNLPRDAYDAHLCTTRTEGPLAATVAPHVHRLRLHRRATFDPIAMRRLARYARRQEIQLFHAHGTALYFAAATAALMRNPPVLIWHDHDGNLEKRATLPLRTAARHLDGIISVTESLAEWAREVLRFPSDRVWYVRNFAGAPSTPAAPLQLPGTPGRRIVCVANFVPLKAQHRLVSAMTQVAAEIPDAHLLLVGNRNAPEYAAAVREQIDRSGMQANVTILGPRDDVPDLLRACDIGVIASDYEGLPMALIEYGMAGIAAASTTVGQCADVLANGDAGVLFPPAAPAQMARGLIRLLQDDATRELLAEKFAKRVRELYGPKAGVERLREVYDFLLRGRLSDD